MSEDARPGQILAALADPTRRAVLDRLRGGPLPVVDIARPIPVSRPAVSQHLRVLLDAGLVEMRSRGTRNIYGLASGGAGPLVDWLGALSARVDIPDPATGLRRDVTTRLTPAEAWRLFCEDIAIWWPVARVSLSALSDGALPQAVTLDPRVGGRLREVLFDGSQADWARVTQARPGAVLALDWRLGIAARAPVGVAFHGEGAGSRLVLTCADESEAAQAMWDAVLDRFAAAANSSLSNF